MLLIMSRDEWPETEDFLEGMHGVEILWANGIEEARTVATKLLEAELHRSLMVFKTTRSFEDVFQSDHEQSFLRVVRGIRRYGFKVPGDWEEWHKRLLIQEFRIRRERAEREMELSNRRLGELSGIV